MHRDPHLNSLKYHLINYMKQAIQIFKSLSGLDSSEYEHISVHISGNANQMVLTVKVIDAGYRRRLLHEWKDTNGIMSRTYEIVALVNNI